MLEKFLEVRLERDINFLEFANNSKIYVL